ncbi:MAG: penicillin-binding protein 2 [Saprospiraceae bacterium]|nr:penicillin-binding protein 2 [Saprospiraceae bacterium]
MESRATVIQYLVGIIGLVILGKLASMQLFDPSYRTRADTATIDKDVIEPSRGLIYDRNGKLLVYNQASYDVYVTHSLLDPKMDTSTLCSILAISKEEFKQRINKDWNDIKFSKKVPFLFFANLSPEKNAQLQEQLHALPGFQTEVHNIRGYTTENAAHLLGYLNEVDEEFLTSNEDQYTQGDYHGVSGLESQYEDQLRGSKGASYRLRDNFGRNVGQLTSGREDASAHSGADITLGIDADLQAYAEKLLQGKTGAFVAIEPASGEILALGSSPSYDPAVLSIDGDRTEDYERLTTDSLKPFFNRAIMAKYPPGSLFKPLISLVALQEEIITADRFITCKGGYFYKIYHWGCHADPGRRNVTSAIQQSCNTFFYTVYRELVDKYGFSKPEEGLDLITDYLGTFGLGTELSIDLPGEHQGLLPTPDFYDDMYEGKGDWRSTYIISNGIGQGEIELTILQMANMMAAIANRGFYYPPHLVKNFRNSLHALDSDYLNRKHVRIEPRHFSPVIEGLERAVYAGTAGLAAVPGLHVCGKTGTSENPHGKDHSVFMAFAPRSNPKIALAVIVENAGWGSTYAAPIGGLMIEEYLNQEIAPNRLWIENMLMEVNLLADL